MLDHLDRWVGRKQSPTDVKPAARCNCTEGIEVQWQGGDHVVGYPISDVEVHFYPDEVTHTITVLKIVGGGSRG